MKRKIMLHFNLVEIIEFILFEKLGCGRGEHF